MTEQFEPHGPRVEIMRLRCAVRGLEEGHKEHARRLLALIQAFHKAVKVWVGYGKPPCGEGEVLALRQALRIMTGREE